MNLLDYWSWTKHHVLDFWREDYGISALKRCVQAEVDNLTIHALDALEIKGRSQEEHNGIRFEFYNYFPDLPNGLDIICALHPNPGVIFNSTWLYSDDEDDETSLYIGFLSNDFLEKAKNWAIVALQFDYQLDKMMYWGGGSEFIAKLQKYWVYRRYHLEHVEPLIPKPRFPSMNYKFSSFHLFEKRDIT